MLTLLCLIPAGIATYIAGAKNRNRSGWFLFGLFVPVIALIMIICLPPLCPECERPVYLCLCRRKA